MNQHLTDGTFLMSVGWFAIGFKLNTCPDPDGFAP